MNELNRKNDPASAFFGHLETNVERLKAITGSSTRKKAKVESTKKRKAEGPVSNAVQKQARLTDNLSTEC